jgi:hypothetical protein
MQWRHLFPFLPLSALVALSIANLGLTGDDGPDQPPAVQQVGASLSVPSCTTVAAGETFALSVFASDLEDLLAWEVYFRYNREVLEVTGRNVNLLLSLAEGSRVFDFSDPVPNVKGLYRMGAADLGSAGSAETGSGLLAVLTLRAKKSGVSWAEIARLDYDDDGVADLGPVLTKLGGEHIGDVNGDGLFDGTIDSGQIAVDTACVTPIPKPSGDVEPPAAGETTTPTPTPLNSDTPSPDDGSEDGGSPDSTPADNQTEGGAGGPATGLTDDELVSVEELLATPGGPATATAVASQTPDADILIRSNPSSSGGGLPTWLIAAVSVAAVVGLLTTLAIMRAARRRPV